MNLECNKEACRLFFDEIYTNARVELIDEVIATNYIAHGPGSEGNTAESTSVRAEGREAVRDSILSKPADIRVVVDDQFAEADTVVSRLTFSSAGVSWVGVAIQRVVNGKIAETWRLTNRR